MTAVTTAMPRGLIAEPSAAGSPTASTRRHEAQGVAAGGSARSMSRSRRITKASGAAAVIARAISDAQAAPSTSSRGSPQSPKISSKSSARLMTATATMIAEGTSASPFALRMLVGTIGITTNGTSRHQIRRAGPLTKSRVADAVG